MSNPIKLIAGPCSAESEEQMLHAAGMLSLIDDNSTLRAGCWKPRTGPGGFEGHGVSALHWLKNAAEAYQLEWMTEAGTVGHVEEILKVGGKQLWIGARTSGDPFTVESIASALKGTGIKVWIKNPAQADVKLWIGAVDRMNRHGVEVAGLIHRGFKIWPSGEYRNSPCWSLVEEARTALPNLPLVCDPSHMAGKKTLVSALAIEGVSRGVDGMMIEMHPNPLIALSDKEQQLTAHELYCLWNEVRSISPSETLTLLRSDIDQLDQLLWDVLAARRVLSKRIGECKSEFNLAALHEVRRRHVEGTYVSRASKMGMSEEIAVRLFGAIHDDSIQLQFKKKIAEMV